MGGMVGNVFLAVLAGWALSTFVVRPIFGLLGDIFLGDDWHGMYSDFYGDELATDLLIRAEIEAEIEAEVEARIEAEIESNRQRHYSTTRGRNHQRIDGRSYESNDRRRATTRSRAHDTGGAATPNRKTGRSRNSTGPEGWKGSWRDKWNVTLLMNGRRQRE